MLKATIQRVENYFTDAISNQEELEDEANKGNEADSEPDDSLEDASTN